jgi:exopolysaccharide production protein ExoZ
VCSLLNAAIGAGMVSPKTDELVAAIKAARAASSTTSGHHLLDQSDCPTAAILFRQGRPCTLRAREPLSTSRSNNDLFTGLQVLRLAAASSVLVAHGIHYALDKKVLLGDVIRDSPHFLPTFGVCSFFVISGFLMGKLGEETRPLSFVLHRVMRIYPAFWAAVALTAVAAFVLGRPLDLDPAILTLLPTGVVKTPLHVEWTLVFEVFFYAVMTIYCALGSQVLRKAVVLAWLVAIIVRSQWPYEDVSQMWPDYSQIGLMTTNAFFIAGLIAWWFRRIADHRPILIFALGVGSIAITWFWSAPWWLPGFILSAAGFALIVMVIASRRVGAWFARSSMLVKGGNASYGIYLMHVFPITSFYALAPLTGWLGCLAAILIAVAIGTMFGLAEHHFYGRMKRWLDHVIGDADNALHSALASERFAAIRRGF